MFLAPWPPPSAIVRLTLEEHATYKIPLVGAGIMGIVPFDEKVFLRRLYAETEESSTHLLDELLFGDAPPE
jgi:hypothetical protein